MAGELTIRVLLRLGHWGRLGRVQVDGAILKRSFKLGDQDISFGDFIGLAFVTALEDMARDIASIGPDPVTARSTSVLLPLHLNPHLLAIGS